MYSLQHGTQIGFCRTLDHSRALSVVQAQAESLLAGQAVHAQERGCLLALSVQFCAPGKLWVAGVFITLTEEGVGGPRGWVTLAPPLGVFL